MSKKIKLMPDSEWDKWCDEHSCPHCGDHEAGYEFVVIVREVRQGGWGDDGESEEVGDWDGQRFPKTVKCNNCGRRVLLEAARKLASER